jgi:hypothetical protein
MYGESRRDIEMTSQFGPRCVRMGVLNCRAQRESWTVETWLELEIVSWLSPSIRSRGMPVRLQRLRNRGRMRFMVGWKGMSISLLRAVERNPPSSVAVQPSSHGFSLGFEHAYPPRSVGPKGTNQSRSVVWRCACQVHESFLHLCRQVASDLSL